MTVAIIFVHRFRATLYHLGVVRCLSDAVESGGGTASYVLVSSFYLPVLACNTMKRTRPELADQARLGSHQAGERLLGGCLLTGRFFLSCFVSGYGIGETPAGFAVSGAVTVTQGPLQDPGLSECNRFAVKNTRPWAAV